MKKILTLVLILAAALPAAAQEKTEVEKEGFSFGAFPIIGYNRDMGMRLGVLGNVYDFGHDGWYPNPRQQMYVEASWYTKGSQAYVLSYDNRFLIPGIRFTFTASYSDESALDFYGFNGYKSWYDADLPSSYYRMSRKMPVGKLDFTGKIAGNLYWKFGYQFKYFILDEFSDDELKSEPYGKSLFSWYKSMGFIEADEYSGGMTSSWRAGLMYDSRDAENDPTRGLWTEAFMEWAPKWMGTNKPYGRYYAVLRHYIPIVQDQLVFAYRANVQGFIGKPAFYVLPSESMLGPGWDRDGFGGYNTIRGLMRNRVQGQAVCYFNTELRWRFLTATVLKQNVALGANVFFDGGRTLKDYTDISVDNATWAETIAIGKFPGQLVKGEKERFHMSAGAGVRFILNRNFIIAVDYGHAFSLQDGGKAGAIYLNTGFLF